MERYYMLCWRYQKKKISPKLKINELSPLKIWWQFVYIFYFKWLHLCIFISWKQYRRERQVFKAFQWSIIKLRKRNQKSLLGSYCFDLNNVYKAGCTFCFWKMNKKHPCWWHVNINDKREEADDLFNLIFLLFH